jgi:hypothetical protein
MNPRHARSSDDLTIILPKASMCTFLSRGWSENRVSKVHSQTPDWKRGLHHERKRRRGRWQAVGTMLVLALVLAAVLTAAARKAAGPTRPADKEIATLLAEQSQPPEEALPTPAAQYSVTQTCTADRTHGTAVNFLATPTDAAREARKNRKLTFLLHISGNFEDGDFT